MLTCKFPQSLTLCLPLLPAVLCVASNNNLPILTISLHASPCLPAVVCGAPGGDLEDASASVAAARGIVEALHTAPLPRLAADGQADGAEG